MPARNIGMRSWRFPSLTHWTADTGYSHDNFITSPEVPQIVGKFLADPLPIRRPARPTSQAASGPR
jgi:hypothetical protein